VRALERIYRRRVPIENITTPELTNSLADASREAGRQVGALVHRSGQVDYVIVGDASKLVLPDIGRLRAAEGRFRGLRLVHTHLRSEPLARDDLVDLVRLRLDLVAAIQLASNGEPRSLVYAYNVPGDDAHFAPYREVGPVPIGRVNVHVGTLMSDLEAEFAKMTRAREIKAKDGRAILVHVADKTRPRAIAGRAPSRAHGEAEESMRELRELARTAGTDVADTVIQVRDHIDPKFVLGKGKLEDVVVRAMQLDAQTLIFDQNLTPAQGAAISKMSDLKVIDRTQLILDIFAQRAESRDGKLQVELAQLKYSLPRLGQKDDSLSRLTGGIGGRGPGETKLEIGRRRAKERVTHLQAQLKQLAKQRQQRRRKRTRGGVPTVAIVGYTNAGKSTLLNTLTGADVLAEDKLFATLDTRSRHLRVGWAGYGGREVILTDTVGFIRDLPKDLFAAFRATFEEAADADLLLQVVDASDPARELHLRTTEELLEELDVDRIPRILVYNKSDLLEPGEGNLLMRGQQDSVLLSARSRETTRGLIDLIAAKLAERWEDAASVPIDRLAEHSTLDSRSPDSPPLGSPPLDAPSPFEETTTLEAMLEAAGKRRKKGPRLLS
jgi:GTPase